MFVKIVDNPPHDGRWYSSMIGEVIEVVPLDLNSYRAVEPEKNYPQWFDPEVDDYLFIDKVDVEVLDCILVDMYSGNVFAIRAGNEADNILCTYDEGVEAIKGLGSDYHLIKISASWKNKLILDKEM